MKRLLVRSTLMMVGLMWFGGMTPVLADERDDRINRLEQRLNETIQQQQQIVQRLGVVADKRFQPRPDAKLLPMPPKHPAGAIVGPRCPFAECGHCVVLGLLLLASVINILIAVWIFTDIRKRGDGHGIFVVLALLAGIPTAIIYALVRIGDKKS